MPEAAALALVPIVFALSVFGPGFLLLRRAAWRPLEIAVASLAVSVLLVGQASFGLGRVWEPFAWRAVLLAACTAATFAALPGVVDLLKARPGARRTLLWFGLLAVWCLGLQAVVRNYSGGNMVHDWINHYERARFWIGWHSAGTLVTGTPVTARPPLMNTFAAQILAVTGTRFAGYEVTAALLGLLAFFPILLVAGLFAPRGGAGLGLPRTVAIVLMFQPMYVQNVSYSWSRMTAVFFVLSSVGFYVEGWRRGDVRRTVFAFACGAAAILTHYSSAPYVLFLALHQLFVVLPRRARPVPELLGIALAGTLVLSPWLAWAGTVYGGDTLLAAGLASSGKPLPTLAANLEKAALNLRDTIVPPLFRDTPRDVDAGTFGWGRLRDEAFLTYQGNLPLALGSLGALLLAIEGIRASRRARADDPPPERGAGPDTWRFWAAFAAFVILTGIGVQGGREPYGLAHTAQQPLVMIGIAFLAARFAAWPRWMRLLAAGGWLLDACLGVLLQFWLQSYPLDLPMDWRGPLGLTAGDLRLMTAGWNWGYKTSAGLRFVADVLGKAASIPAVVVATLFLVAAITLSRLALVPSGAAPDRES